MAVTPGTKIKIDFKKQKDYVRKIYEVNNHNVPNTEYGENPINSSLQVYDNSLEEGHFSEQFPQLLKKNPYMKPSAGITQVSSETEGGLGIIKKTTINFVVHNFMIMIIFSINTF